MPGLITLFAVSGTSRENRGFICADSKIEQPHLMAAERLLKGYAELKISDKDSMTNVVPVEFETPALKAERMIWVAETLRGVLQDYALAHVDIILDEEGYQVQKSLGIAPAELTVV